MDSRQTIDTIMIITKISDGFGNQLFMYACGYAVAQRLNTKLILDTSYLDTNKLRSYELDKLNIRFAKRFSTNWLKLYPLKVLYRKIEHFGMRMRYSMYKEKKTYLYDPEVLCIKNNTYLSGYWQSELYFKEYRNDLLALFTPKYELSIGCKEYIEQVRSCNSVAVHVRRGDYVKIGICLDASYYFHAFEHLEQTMDDITYFVFSDDIEYARQMFVNAQRKMEYVHYTPANPTLDDFFIMKACKHIIMANSSFSWWAAWLNNNPDKQVLYPKTNWAGTNFYPEAWTMIQ